MRTNEQSEFSGGSVSDRARGTTEELLSTDQSVREHRLSLTHVIAATPGWFVVYAVEDREEPTLGRCAIAGWARNDVDQLEPLIAVMETGGKPRLMLADRACKVVGIVSPGGEGTLEVDGFEDLTDAPRPSKRARA